MKSLSTTPIIILMILLVAPPAAHASPVYSLFEYAFNLDGTLWDSLSPAGPLPSAIDLGGFDTTTGLGTIKVTVSGIGSHNFIAFLDHEIDEAVNGYSNEQGAALGALPAGMSWEIDEPGFGSSYTGDIYGNVMNGSLDNLYMNGNAFAEDVSMALGWNFSLQNLDQAIITLTLAEQDPGSGFRLRQWDPDSAGNVYLGGNLAIDTNVVPEPSQCITLLILLGGTGLALARRRRNNQPSV